MNEVEPALPPGQGQRITRAALRHEARTPFAFPLGPDRLHLMAISAAGEIDTRSVRFGDRYASARGEKTLPLAPDGSDGVRDYWVGVVPVPTRRLRYRFQVAAGGESLWWGEGGFGARPTSVAPFQFPYLASGDLFRAPEWLGAAVTYEIFPDRFRNGDPDNDPPENRLPWGRSPRGGSESAGGDLEGIRASLDYLVELGIDTVYLTPIFSAGSNHKYDTNDYRTVDPAFGGNDSLARLVSEAHDRGIRMVLDAVFNHCGSGFFAFRDLIEHGRESCYLDWFHRIDSFPVDPERANYETFANGIGSMPKLNTANPECAEYLLETATGWIETAKIDGWRVDVANEVDHAFLRRLRDRVKAASPEAWILGEVWHDAGEWLRGDQFDSVMNYPWRDAVLAFLTGRRDAREFDRELRRLRRLYAPPFVAGALNLLGSHDTPRIRTALGSAQRAGLATALLFTAPGIPMLYYGDEIGMEGAGDPDCRRCMEWDRERWHLPTLDLHRRLIRMRRERPWLAEGGWETLQARDGERTLVYRRDNRRALGALPPDGPPQWLSVAINAGSREAKIEIDPRSPPAGTGEWGPSGILPPEGRSLGSSPGDTVDLLTGERLSAERMTLPAASFRILGSPAL